MRNFDDEPFGSVVDESSETDLQRALTFFQKEYFSGVPCVAGLEIAPDVPGPALLTETGAIRVHSAAATWPRTARVLILHELIHHALQQKDVSDDEDGEPFQAELERLWKAGAYRKLL